MAASFFTSLPRSHLFGLVLALSLAVSSLNSKAMGLAWLLLVLAGAWAAAKHRGLSNAAADFPWVKAWCLVVTIALVIKSVPMLYWSDPWEERHGELRLFFGAWALYGLVTWHPMKRFTLTAVAHALTLTSAVGLAWVIAHGRDGAPTHPIPWAGGMAMVSALLLALGLKSDLPNHHRRLWLIGGLLAVMAVLSSQSRGAYGIVLWWMAVALHHMWVKRDAVPAARTDHYRPWLTPRKWAWIMGICFSLAWLSQTPVIERPAQSMQDAVKEIRLSQQSITEGSVSSVGARLYMWQQSLYAIEQAPWLGQGRAARKNLLHTWGQVSQSPEVQRLGHVHNEYLNQMVDHGLWGLISQLLYVLGLFWISWLLLKRDQNTAAFAVAGIAFMHMTTSLTNVNFAHNYYTAAFSMLLGLSLWMTSLRED